MSFLVSKLKHRIQIRMAVQSPESEFGSFETAYKTLVVVWAGIKPMSDYIQAIRGEQIDSKETHEFLIRYNSIYSAVGRAFADGFGLEAFDSVDFSGLGKEFTSAFSSEYKNMADLNPYKADLFIFLEQGSSVKGRLFKIHRMMRDDYHQEYMKIRAEEIEEKGTGYPEVRADAEQTRDVDIFGTP